jgi:endonuclease/exonuclease/phosphatase family metal-dependent hydrolase
LEQAHFMRMNQLLALTATLAWAGADTRPPADPMNTVTQGSFSQSTAALTSPVVLDWNIDRGFELARIDAAISAQKPDILVFQEVDLHARRTHGIDVARKIAEEFHLNYAFGVEFQELSQGSKEEPAYHGQATLSTLPIRSSRVIRFAHQSGWWKPHRLMTSSMPIFQRRLGGRIALLTELDNGGKTIAVYNLHLESKGTENLRLEQLNEVLEDANRYPPEVPVIVTGDLNTMHIHSPLIARLKQAGYKSCLGDRKVRTHALIGSFDWMFMRGPAEFADAKVHREIHGSDHYPIVAVALLR